MLLAPGLSNAGNTCFPYHQSLLSARITTTDPAYTIAERRVYSDYDTKAEGECFYIQLEEATLAVEMLKNEAFAEQLKCKKLENEATEAIRKFTMNSMLQLHLGNLNCRFCSLQARTENKSLAIEQSSSA